MRKKIALWTVILSLGACSARKPKTDAPAPAPAAPQSLEQLKKSYLELQAFYGYEGSFPDIFSSEQYPQHATLEKEITTRTMKPLQASFSLTHAEIAALKQREDPNAIYVLFRLIPKEAKKILTARLSGAIAASPAAKCEARFGLIEHFQKDFKKGALKKLIGPGDRKRAKDLLFDCGEDMWPRLQLVQSEGTTLKTKMLLHEE